MACIEQLPNHAVLRCGIVESEAILVEARECGEYGWARLRDRV